jgi:hypothetical protein
VAFSASLQQRRYVPLLITTGLHVVLLYWLLQYRPALPKQPEAEQWSVLLLLPSPIAPPKAEPEKAPAVSGHSTRAVSAASSSSQPSNAETHEPSKAITVAPEESVEQEPKPTIDWSAEAKKSAKDAAARVDAKPQQRVLDGSDKKETAKPKKNSEFEWRPETKRFGLTQQGLPYIRLNRRCVLLPPLPLFGCGLGKLAPPNRELFEGMDDSDASKAAAPDAGEPH